MPQIKFLKQNQVFEVAPGSSILECALEHDIPLDHDCGGNCACTTCHVFIESGAQNLEAMGDDERGLLEANDKLDEKSRLGCQSRIKNGLVVVRTPD